MEVYDFIIVGAGASGCLLASRLARALKDQQILLVDAGGTNANPDYQNFGERNWTLMTVPGYNWGYKTVPQLNLAGREIDYSRGKGLGGSTTINFCVYTRGPSAEYDRWAQLVDDDVWSWTKVLERFKKIEKVHAPSQDYKRFVDVSESAHGSAGPVSVSLPDVWEHEFGDFLEAAYGQYPQNLDNNSGDPIGISVCQLGALNGRRVTAASAYLSDPSPNLTILTESPVEKVCLDNLKAVGIQVNGKFIYSRKEVILSAGTLDTPKLLLLSGIGPSSKCEPHGIPMCHERSGVGKNLHDHLFLELVTTRKNGSHHRSSYLPSSPEAFEEARKQWMKDQTGPLSEFYLPQMISYLKSHAVLQSEEFQDLDKFVQEALLAETVPNYEIYSHVGTPTVVAPEQYLAFVVAFMGFQGTGEVKLRSANPEDPPLIDPKFLSHPYDRRVAIEAVRDALQFLDMPYLAKDQIRLATGPKGRSDEEILKYVQDTAISMWHMCGTCKMGKPEDPDAVVDKDFHVVGTKGLRVVDMSVAPFMLSAHTQAAAYLIGETAAEKIIAEYS